MKRFYQIARFEAAHQARQRSTWIYAAVFLGLSFLAMTRFVANARGVLFNAPLAVAGATIITGLLGLLITAALAGDVATRDAQTRMEPLLHSTPVSKRAYLYGKFLGAFGVNALLLTAVPAGLVLAALWQRLAPGLAGPYRPAAYAGAYVFLALPNAFIATALLFSAATLRRTAVASYVSALLLFLAALVVDGVLAEAMGRWELARLLDPFGIVLLRELVRSWTPVQKDTLLIGLHGALLWNRLLWLAVAAGALALTGLRFRFGHPTAAGRKRAARALTQAGDRAGMPPAMPIVAPRFPRVFGLATHTRQTLDVARRSFSAIVMSRGAAVLLVPAAFLVLLGPQRLVHLGTPVLPTTAHLLGIIAGSGDLLLSLAAPFLTVVYAGELVWREREAGLGDLADVTPMPDWVPFVGKLLGLGLVLVVLQALMMAAGVLLQASLGYRHFEIGLYLRVLFGIQLSEYLLFAVLAFAVHTVVNQKSLGHLAVLLAYAFTAFAAKLGIGQSLLVYGSDPGWAYSDMRGFEPFVAPLLGFRLYWGAWALLLAVVATLLWVRGRERGFMPRLEQARRRLTPAAVGIATAAGIGILWLGGFLLDGTKVLNAPAWKAEDAPQPRMTAARLNVEIYPKRREVEIRGTFDLVNRSGSVIDSIHLVPAAGVETRSLRFDHATTCVLANRIYRLAAPLQPGDSLRLGFETHFRPHGIDPSVVANGTFFTQEWLPAAGDRDRTGRERIRFDAVVGTDEGQIAVAPGALRRTWMKDGRRYFHYATGAPIRNDYAFFSAAYAVREAQWQGVAIQIFHHPGHAWNVERMIRAVQASLDDYTRRFGPYPYREIRLVERPGDGDSLHSSPIDISYQEGFSLYRPEDGPRQLDFPFAVVAHEVAHQWWANQVTPAPVEGAPLLTESLAWYSAMGVVQRTYGDDALRQLLDLMRQAYRAPRARANAPLLRATDRFLAYRKGPFALYAWREYVGAERIDTALRRFLAKHGSGEPPLPTSRDLYRELQAVTPGPLRPLLADLFERNTFWELAAERVTARQTGAGSWQVTLDVRARKVVVDRAGIETEVPMNDLVEIGVFAPGEPLRLGLRRIRSGKQRITVTVPERPARAGIDPRGLLIDTEPGDNVKEMGRS